MSAITIGADQAALAEQRHVEMLAAMIAATLLPPSSERMETVKASVYYAHQIIRENREPKP